MSRLRCSWEQWSTDVSSTSELGLNISEESEVRRLRHIGKVIDHVLDLETHPILGYSSSIQRLDSEAQEVREDIM